MEHVLNSTYVLIILLPAYIHSWDSHINSFLKTDILSLSVQNGWTALEIAEVMSVDIEAEIMA